MKLFLTLLAFAFLLVATQPNIALAAAPLNNPTDGGAIYSVDFENSNPLQGWSISDPNAVHVGSGTEGGHGIDIAVPAAKPGTAKISLPIDVSKMRDAYIRVDAMVKATDVAKPPTPYNGIKVMLVVQEPTATHYPQQQNVYGTFDWRKVGFVNYIPKDATKATLVLGIEDSSGTADFDNVHISLVDTPRQPPAHVAFSEPAYTGHAVPELRGMNVVDRIDDTGAQVLKKWNVNVVRFQLHPKGDVDDDTSKSTWNASMTAEMDKLDRFLPYAKRNGLLVVVDLHGRPGGRLPGQQGDRLFHDVKYQDVLAQTWETLSKKYSGNKTVWGYDLVNEPLEGNITEGVPNWQQLATRLARIVRHNDSDHAIIVESINSALPENLRFMTPIPVQGVVYSIHMYTPWPFTAQGIYKTGPPVAYPGVIGGKMWDKKALEAYLQPAIDFQRDYNVDIYVGEFSAVRWAPGAAQYLSDLISIFDAHHWDWTYHCFREYQGWDLEDSDTLMPYKDAPNSMPSSTTPTDRLLVVQAALAKNVAVNK